VDDDGDGTSECRGDCNDADNAVFPGAPQLCDGRNNDCGDPSWPAVPPGEVDDDLDGLAECQGDCNDANGNIRPGKPELCSNGLDDDCDTFTDTADPDCPTSCPDADDDGIKSAACQPGGDCNDADPAVYPGAPQLCDGKNNDCSDPAWPAVPSTEQDADADGLRNCADNCPSTPNPSQADADFDHKGDACDSCSQDAFNDKDGDGLCGQLDRCPFVADPTNRDTDGDGVGDVCDTCATSPNLGEPDIDGDGRQGRCDSDEDGDGTLNNQDPDADNDGIRNDGDNSGRVGDKPCLPGQVLNCDDNCTLAPNRNQADEDGDSTGNACDGDDRLNERLAMRPRGVQGAPWDWVAWEPEKNAVSYQVYRSVLAGPGPPPNAGDCYHNNVRTLYTPAAENPGPGQAFGYLASGDFPGGAGSLGRSSNGATRTPGTTCP
jgi:hypothetical protein